MFDILTDQQKQAVSAVLAESATLLKSSNETVVAAKALILAVPPAQVGAIMDRLSESADRIKDASEKLEKAADNILLVSSKLANALK